MTRFSRTPLQLHKTNPDDLKLTKPEKKGNPGAFSYCSSADNRPPKPDNFRRRVMVLTLFLLLILSLIPSPAVGAKLLRFSQQKEVLSPPYYLNPIREIQLLKKILTFERSWKTRAGQELVIGILYQKASSISSWIMEDWLNLPTLMSENDLQLERIPIVFQKIELDSISSLEATLVENRIQILYIPPLETQNNPKTLNKITRLCEKLKIGTFTAVPEYLDSGVAISFQLKEEKPQILINLEASRAQGFDFSSQLLRLAKIKGKNG